MKRIKENAVNNWGNSPDHFRWMNDPDSEILGVGVTSDKGRASCYMMVSNPNAYNPYT